MFSDVSTSSAVIGPSARSESRCAILAAASASSLGNVLKMPPGDLPVTTAQVANVTRSAASRGGMSEFSALATVSWLSASAAAAKFGLPLAEGPDGSVGGGGIGASEAGGAGTSDAVGAAGVAPVSSSACALAISSVRLRLLVLVQLLDLAAMLDRVLDQLLHVVEVGVAHGLQLDRRQVEVVLDAVLDPHRHQRVQAQLDQRHLPRQVLGFVTHGRRHDGAQSLGDGLAGFR